MTSMISALREFLWSHSVTGYLVGGYVRDSLLGVPSKDIDVAVNGDAGVVGRGLADLFDGTLVPLDPEHGVVRVMLNQWQVSLDISSFHDSIETDLAGRDFTIDAMALPLARVHDSSWSDEIIDPVGGRRDLTQGLIRKVTDTVFREDPARLLRAVRLARTFGFDIEPETCRLIARDTELLSDVSMERIRDEFLGLLSIKGSKESLHCLDDLGLLYPIIPELEATRGLEQPREHYWDVFEHTIQAVGAVDAVTGEAQGGALNAGIPWNDTLEEHFSQVVSDGHNRRTILKLGALFHDIAKPQTKAVDQTGRTRFLGHSDLGASMAEGRLRSLRLSSLGIKRVCTMVKHHLRPTQMSSGVEMPTKRATYRFFRDLGDEAVSVLYLNLADYLAAKGPELEDGDWRRHVGLIAHILEEYTAESGTEERPRLITGHDLVQTFGLEPGPIFGRLLDAVEQSQATQIIRTRDEALALVKIHLDQEKE